MATNCNLRTILLSSRCVIENLVQTVDVDSCEVNCRGCDAAIEGILEMVKE